MSAHGTPRKASGKGYRKAMAAYERALAHNELGNWGLADEEFFRALVLFQRLEMWPDVANCHCSVGNVSHNKGHHKETVKHWLSAVEICELRLHDYARAGELLMDVGDLQYENKEVYAAGDSYERALTAFGHLPETGQEMNLARVQHRLGNVCFSLDRIDAAEKHLVKALTEYDAMGREDEVAVVTKAIGHIYMARNDYETAKQNFMACFATFAKMGRDDVKREVAGLLTVIDNREKSVELAARLKQIESGASPDNVDAAYAMAMGGFHHAALPPASGGSMGIGAGLGDENDELGMSNAHANLSAVNPNAGLESSKRTYSPIDSKKKKRVKGEHTRLAHDQQLHDRITEQRSPRVPLQTASRRQVPRKKF